ncbi:MAG TPA: DUF4439 domain-containing protein [Flexivirga sp.]|uniref:DUF4439 domain-containing protein n=1 Tax=Flexivirga sp. TaxID=1962927 RepID=UPI002C9DA026|nr:DUF4439 domain-containing protein [Flexivirga sp.]HWC23105.1 DUF4439 domain-containing protein [Flexivirga sp.]
MPIAEQRAMVRRRAVLAAALAGSVAGLSGCGIRLESDAPHIPGIKKQGPPPDQKPLEQLFFALRKTATAAASAPAADLWAGKLGTMHLAQAKRLTAVMSTQGMKVPSYHYSSSGASGDLVDYKSAERINARRIGSLTDVTERNLPMAAAIAVTQNAAAHVLGEYVEPAGGSVPKTAVVEAILPSLRAAAYALEVIIAKTPLDARKRAEATVTMLHATRATWEASLGKDVPPSPDGFTLPVNPTTDDARQKLAQRVLTDLITACAGQVTATRGDQGAFIGLTTLWADSTAQLWRWGAAPAPFPGLA